MYNSSIRPLLGNRLPAGSHFIGDVCQLWTEEMVKEFKVVIEKERLYNEKLKVRCAARTPFHTYIISVRNGIYNDNKGDKYEILSSLLCINELKSNDMYNKAKSLEMEGKGKILVLNKDYDLFLSSDDIKIGETQIFLTGSEKIEEEEDINEKLANIVFNSAGFNMNQVMTTIKDYQKTQKVIKTQEHEVDVELFHCSILPDGTYYIGDLSYLLPQYILEKYTLHKDFIDKPVTIISKEYGRFFSYFAPTDIGDGAYDDNFENTYCVDSGIIGIVELSDPKLLKKAYEIDKNNMGRVIDFDESFNVSWSNGDFMFGDIEILTRC